jgi:hypothetical protein
MNFWRKHEEHRSLEDLGMILKLVVYILLRVLDQVQGFPSNATLPSAHIKHTPLPHYHKTKTLTTQNKNHINYDNSTVVTYQQ